VGIRNKKRKPKRDRPKKIIRNSYGRRGKPKETRRTHEEEGSTEQSDIEANLIEVNEPQDINEILSFSQAKHWKSAIKEELDSLIQKKLGRLLKSLGFLTQRKKMHWM